MDVLRNFVYARICAPKNVPHVRFTMSRASAGRKCNFLVSDDSQKFILAYARQK